jgi:glucosamine-phosphate N-acetyltransferase
MIFFIPMSKSYQLQHYELMLQFKGISNEDAPPFNEELYDRFLEDVYNNPNHHIYLGLCGGDDGDGDGDDNNNENKTVVCAGTLLIEPKMIHNYSKAGHIEDIVVHKDYRRRGFGKQLIEFLTNKAKEEGCYKVILDCSLENVQFYMRSGYDMKEQQMVKYINE